VARGPGALVGRERVCGGESLWPLCARTVPILREIRAELERKACQSRAGPSGEGLDGIMCRQSNFEFFFGSSNEIEG